MIQITMQKPILSAPQAKARMVRTTTSGCGSSMCSSSWPLATRASYSSGLSRFNSARGMWPVKTTVSMGNFCRRVKRTNSRSGRIYASRPDERARSSAVRRSRSAGMIILAIGVRFVQSGLFCRFPGFFGAQLSAHLDGFGQPQQRVNAAEDEGADEQGGHAPERPEQERIFLRVVVGGVGQVAGKAAGRIGVALLTSGDDIGAAQMRARVGDAQDIVRAVAVVTLGGSGVAKARNFTVVSLEVSLGDFYVALAALAHDFELEAGFIGAADLVGAVAIAADGQFLVGLGDGCGVHALDELFL